jgi:hypothetical protein
MCDAHARHVGHEKDLCPDHAKDVVIATVKAPSLAWPATAEQLAAAGYRDERRSKWCSCGVIMFWFATPAGKFIPLEATKDSRFEPHHAKCKHVKAFRGADRNYRDRPSEPEQQALFPSKAETR